MYVMEKHSAIKRNEPLKQNLSGSPGNYAEKEQSHTVTNCMIPFIKYSLNDKTIEMENRLEAASDWEVGLRGSSCGYKRLHKGSL